MERAVPSLPPLLLCSLTQRLPKHQPRHLGHHVRRGAGGHAERVAHLKGGMAVGARRVRSLFVRQARCSQPVSAVTPSRAREREGERAAPATASATKRMKRSVADASHRRRALFWPASPDGAPVDTLSRRTVPARAANAGRLARRRQRAGRRRRRAARVLLGAAAVEDSQDQECDR